MSSSRKHSHNCAGCLSSFPTRQGLNSHYSQKPKCRQRLLDDYRALQSRSHHPVSTPTAHDENPVFLESENTLNSPDIDNTTDIIDPDYAPHHNANNEEPRKRARNSRVHIEEVEDEDRASASRIWVREHPKQPETLGRCTSSFEHFRNQQREHGLPPWAPWSSKEEWEVAEWLTSSGASQSKMDTFLKLPKVSK